MQRTALCARKIVAILKVGNTSSAFPIYKCAAADAQRFGHQPYHISASFRRDLNPNLSYLAPVETIMSETRKISIEGYTPDAIMALPDEQLNAFIFTGEPLIFQAGSASILGEFRRSTDRITIELAQIDGDGEDVLPTLWRLAERYAQTQKLKHLIN